MGAQFNWGLKVVDGVGHDYRLMGQAAAEFLYGDSDTRQEECRLARAELRSGRSGSCK